MASILVLGVKVPFTRGGADTLVNTLVAELKRRGHEADTIDLPFQIPPKESLLTYCAQWRAMNLNTFIGKEVDLVVATKFPSYFARHPRKSLWMVHQHRPIYELYGGSYSDFSDDPRDEALRRMLQDADTTVLREFSYRSAISGTVAQRMRNFNGLEAEVLYPPLPLGDRYRTAEPEDFILSVGRICGIKRVDLMLKSLPQVHRKYSLKIVGQPDEPGIMDYLKNEVAKHHLWDRVEFLGRVDDPTLIDLYSRCSAVYYAPHNEDYGYVTLEAMAARKPVITAHDSGGVLEFVRDGETGVVLAPDSASIAQGINSLFDDEQRARRLGIQGREHLEGLGVFDSGWQQIIDRLLSPLDQIEQAQAV